MHAVKQYPFCSIISSRTFGITTLRVIILFQGRWFCLNAFVSLLKSGICIQCQSLRYCHFVWNSTDLRAYSMVWRKFIKLRTLNRTEYNTTQQFCSVVYNKKLSHRLDLNIDLYTWPIKRQLQNLFVLMFPYSVHIHCKSPVVFKYAFWPWQAPKTSLNIREDATTR